MKTMSVLPYKLVHGGFSLAKIEGKTVFIEGAIPGEAAEIEILSEKKDFLRARFLKTEAASPLRRLPPCPYYRECGGCNLQHIDDDAQREFRRQIVADCFSRSGVELAADIIRMHLGSPFGYRCRVLLHEGGFMGRQSNISVPVRDCPVAAEPIRAFLKETESHKRQAGELRLFGDERVLCTGGLAAVQTGGGRRGSSVSSGSPYAGEAAFRCAVRLRAALTGGLCEKDIAFDLRGFFQSNLELLEKTVGIICAEVGGGRILDMYAGSGVFAAFLAEQGAYPVLVEHNRGALVYAEENLRGVPHRSYAVSGACWVRHHAEAELREGGFDAVCVDPPRGGMEKEVCGWLCKNRPRKICSLSCDPATQARDCAQLMKSGYRLIRLDVLDFYPQTGHTESLAVLEI